MAASTQQEDYLASKVLTAPPHKLHLMLIEGAIRYGRQAEQAMLRGDVAAAGEPLARVIDILGEMLAGVRGQKSDLNRRIADFYMFLFRRVSEAKVNDDDEKLTEALELLEYERQSWQLVCQKLQSDPRGDAASASNGSGNGLLPSPTGSNGATAWPPLSTFGFSLEA